MVRREQSEYGVVTILVHLHPDFCVSGRPAAIGEQGTEGGLVVLAQQARQRRAYQEGLTDPQPRIAQPKAPRALAVDQAPRRRR